MNQTASLHHCLGSRQICNPVLFWAECISEAAFPWAFENTPTQLQHMYRATIALFAVPSAADQLMKAISQTMERII